MRRTIPAVLLAVGLTGCGGGSTPAAAPTAPAPVTVTAAPVTVSAAPVTVTATPPVPKITVTASPTWARKATPTATRKATATARSTRARYDCTTDTSTWSDAQINYCSGHSESPVGWYTLANGDQVKTGGCGNTIQDMYPDVHPECIVARRRR